MSIPRLAAGGAAVGLMLGLAVMIAVGQPQQPPIVVAFTSAKVLLDPSAADTAFRQAEARTIPLVAQALIKPFGGGTVREIRLRALHDGRMIYFELMWADPTSDWGGSRSTEFSDAVALQFPLTTDPPLASPLMGDRNRPVNIWQWKAVWQNEVTHGRDLRAIYPNMFVDFYYDVHLAKTVGDREGFNAGIAAGNLASRPRRTSAVEDLVAWGFGTLTTQPHQDVIGFGTWKTGRWTVVMARPLVTHDASDVQFSPGKPTLVNFAVWDGSHHQRNGQKSVTLTWWPVTLRPPR